MPRWDPYAQEQSASHRVRSARRGDRPTRRLVTGEYYQLLGLAPDASAEEIDRAYRRYASQIHPDRFFDDPDRQARAEAKLKQLNAAVHVLRDPVRRARYDEKLRRSS